MFYSWCGATNWSRWATTVITPWLVTMVASWHCLRRRWPIISCVCGVLLIKWILSLRRSWRRWWMVCSTKLHMLFRSTCVPGWTWSWRWMVQNAPRTQHDGWCLGRCSNGFSITVADCCSTSSRNNQSKFHHQRGGSCVLWSPHCSKQCRSRSPSCNAKTWWCFNKWQKSKCLLTIFVSTSPSTMRTWTHLTSSWTRTRTSRLMNGGWWSPPSKDILRIRVIRFVTRSMLYLLKIKMRQFTTLQFSLSPWSMSCVRSKQSETPTMRPQWWRCR